MAKVKAVSIADMDDVRNLMESARAIAGAISSVDKELGLNHDDLWRLGSEIHTKLDKALGILGRIDYQEIKAA